MSQTGYEKWNIDAVSDWVVSNLKLTQYSQRFKDMSIDGSILDHITEEDLINDLDIKVRLHRIKILEGIKRLKESKLTRDDEGAESVSIPSSLGGGRNAENINPNGEFHSVGGIRHAEPTTSQQNYESQRCHGDAGSIESSLKIEDDQNEVLHERRSEERQLSALVDDFDRACRANPGGSGDNVNPERVGTSAVNNRIAGIASRAEEEEEEINARSAFSSNRQNVEEEGKSAVIGNQVISHNNDGSPEESGQVSSSVFNGANVVQAQGNNYDILVLKAVEGQLLNNIFIVGATGATLGRHSASNDIVISESFVSRRHCDIKYHNGQFYIADAGSTTGTFLMIRTPVAMKYGLMFQMGLSEFKVNKITKDSTGQDQELELYVFEGPSRGSTIKVEHDGIYIGRDPSNSLCVKEDSQMSSFHAKITAQGGEFMLQDVGSTNRTWLRLSSEGEKSRAVPIKVHDIIKIGSTVFVVQQPDLSQIQLYPNSANNNNSNVNNPGAVGDGLRGIDAGQEDGDREAFDSNLADMGLQDGGAGLREPNRLEEVAGAAGGNFSPSKSINDEAACKICYEHEYNVAFYPCGHVACQQCARRMTDRCPHCRNLIEKTVKLYK
eukprot:CAMPEP_0114998274 /NCGR_PEP_ID=MMETSP0216-20121206/15401_1 /TAXON_ID=223996 /ORGANISM="Protocruzia adherens, Strain Boccale" /LENGTH=609 /DNA_ID=CAMNT_0002362823 /DNA_START=61 /DNA_END=1890 /DNA_ORIENTATION=-